MDGKTETESFQTNRGNNKKKKNNKKKAVGEKTRENTAKQQQGKKAENQLGNRNTIHSNNASSGWVFVRGVLENPMAGVFKASKQI